MEKKDSDRRSFFSRIAKLGIAGGIGALLLGRLGDKTFVPPVHAANIEIDAYNTGSGTTQLASSPAGTSAFLVKNGNTATFSSAIFGKADAAGSNPLTGIYGELTQATSGVGVHGKALATSGDTIGVLGESNSTYGTGVKGAGGSRGVYGTASGVDSAGVQGFTSGGRGAGWTPPCGVLGSASKSGAVGVLGEAASLSGSVIPMVARGAQPSQSADLQQWQVWQVLPTRIETVAVINKDGWMGIGNSSPARQLHVQGNQAVSRMDRDVDSAAFIFVRTAPGDFGTVWKSFMFGADASGVNNGRFVIGDLGTAVGGVSTKRLVIDNTGRVGIGTETPTEKLHVAGNVKASGFITGDIEFANGVKATEEGDGLAFVNQQGKKIAVLDSEGNLQVKGKITENPLL